MLSTTVRLSKVEKLIEAEPKWRHLITKWLAGDIAEEDHHAMTEIMETYIDRNVIIWPPGIRITVENESVTLEASAMYIVGKA